MSEYDHSLEPAAEHRRQFFSRLASALLVHGTFPEHGDAIQIFFADSVGTTWRATDYMTTKSWAAEFVADGRDRSAFVAEKRVRLANANKLDTSRSWLTLDNGGVAGDAERSVSVVYPRDVHAHVAFVLGRANITQQDNTSPVLLDNIAEGGIVLDPFDDPDLKRVFDVLEPGNNPVFLDVPSSRD